MQGPRMAMQGGGIGRIVRAPDSAQLRENITRVESESDQSTNGPFGSTRSKLRVFEIRSPNPHEEALATANELGRGGRERPLKNGGWVRDFGDRSAVTFRPSTTSVADMPGVTLTIRHGATRDVYEIHYLPRSQDAK